MQGNGRLGAPQPQKGSPSTAKEKRSPHFQCVSQPSVDLQKTKTLSPSSRRQMNPRCAVEMFRGTELCVQTKKSSKGVLRTGVVDACSEIPPPPLSETP